MKIFIQALDYNLLRIIVNKLHIPSYNINNIVALKSELDWNDDDMRMAQLSTKYVSVLYYELDVNKFNRISTCSSIKEIWDKLEVTHKGTNQVKESKINMLVHKYELFKIEPNELITGVYAHFIDIVNNLKNLDKSYTDFELFRKILHSLPRT